MAMIAAGPVAPAERAEPPVLSSATLLRGARKVVIEHDGERYTLQVTRQGKLLLTK